MYGRRPKRLLRISIVSSEISINDHLCPGLFTGVMICLVAFAISQDCRVVKGFDSQRSCGL